MLLNWTRDLTGQKLRADLLAGLSGAVLGLPQVMAYAMIAGMPPETGLYSAIIVTALAALLGSSWHMITGPAAAISIVILSIVSPLETPGSATYIALVLTLTLLTGLIQIGFGIFRLGSLVNFISHTVVIGFTAGAAFLIAASQLKHLLALSVPSNADLFATLTQVLRQLGQINPIALTIGLVTLLSAALLRVAGRRLGIRLPHLLLGLIIGSLTGYLLDAQQNGVAMLGALPGGLPIPGLPAFSADTLESLATGAFALALLGLIEAVSIARAIALRSHQQIDGNREFLGQGIANASGSLFSCFAGSGSFTRSGANYDSGAQTPLAAIFGALCIALIMFTIPDITGWLPLPAMAGSILLIAWNLIDMPHIRQIARASRTESIVLTATFAATLLVNPVFSIYVGVFLSIAFYLRRTSRPSVIPVAPLQNNERRSIRNVQRYRLEQCPQLQMIRIDGSMFFGCVDHIQAHLRRLAKMSEGPPLILIIGKGINFIDVSAAEMLIQEAERIEAQGGKLMFSSFKGILLDDLERTGLLARMGAARFFGSTEEAIASCVPDKMNLSICDRCTARIFNECPPLPLTEHTHEPKA
ncbi:SulP family inorganic anion transporter [Marinobacterium sp. D7]|uniref:SulP family inorganic anion transporter n=1 Tax=Marinobacterium ramblicola TaxID=2849041 RepID=UPI001C2D6E1C|nr:SulP family inorganic anion transporter [Marinobacterium ramblicola]MBV1790571.1 SulP family inorganic anion transporter [Marinobacterium ramblicola]